MAEPAKHKKVSLRDIMQEIAEDEAFSDEDRQVAFEKVKELEYEAWCLQQMKSKA